MGLIDTSHVKIKPELPYMTKPEASLFKKLRDGNALSVFRIALCKRCGVEIPQNKTHCSKAHYQEDTRAK
jgi:ribosomal protein L40E